MNRRGLPSHTRLGIELEQALADWISASRRVYEPAHDLGDEQAEHVAWRRVLTVLGPSETQTAA